MYLRSCTIDRTHSCAHLVLYMRLHCPYWPSFLSFSKPIKKFPLGRKLSSWREKLNEAHDQAIHALGPAEQSNFHLSCNTLEILLMTYYTVQKSNLAHCQGNKRMIKKSHAMRLFCKTHLHCSSSVLGVATWRSKCRSQYSLIKRIAIRFLHILVLPGSRAKFLDWLLACLLCYRLNCFLGRTQELLFDDKQLLSIRDRRYPLSLQSVCIEHI